MKIILASQSPRRSQLLKEAGYSFEIIPCHEEEIIPDGMLPDLVTQHLALQKATFVFNDLVKKKDEYIVIGADTIVVKENKILGKPKSRQEAINTLKLLSNSTHEVLTGVAIVSLEKTIQFVSSSKVIFAELSTQEIEYYIDNFSPYDKAGSYGIQDWIGLCKVVNIDGLYSNIMGLPIQMVYDYLINDFGITPSPKPIK